MKNLMRALAYSLVTAALVASGFPVAVHAACAHHQQAAPCGCCPAQQTQSCEALCQTAEPAATLSVAGQEQAKPARRSVLVGAKSLLPQAMQDNRLASVRFSIFAATDFFTPPRLYLQSHNLRL